MHEQEVIVLLVASKSSSDYSLHPRNIHQNVIKSCEMNCPTSTILVSRRGVWWSYTSSDLSYQFLDPADCWGGSGTVLRGI